MVHVLTFWYKEQTECIRPSRTSKVDDFGSNRKRTWNFLLVLNSKQLPWSYLAAFQRY